MMSPTNRLKDLSIIHKVMII